MGILLKPLFATLPVIGACLGVFCGYAAESTANPPETDKLANSVVKVFSTVRDPDPYQPWTKQSPEHVTGSGVVIEGKRILSNAHVVLYASQVEIQANQSGDKIPATVEFIAPEIDLAILKLSDDSFFSSHPAMPRAKQLPNVADTVMAYGYPTGGSGLSITKGVVSRLDFASYHRELAGLRIQIDAAINPGNSGGPAIADGQMIGLVFSRLTSSDNIGYIIPTEEIDLFLADIATGRYHGKPGLHDNYQTLENQALRSYLKIPANEHGILVHRPASTNANYPLKEWDLITRIANAEVDDQGMVKIEGSQRVHFRYMVQKAANDGKIHLRIVRDGKAQELDVPVTAPERMLIPELNGEYPSYFIFGPLVFSPATYEYYAGYSTRSYGGTYLAYYGSPLVKRLAEHPSFEGEQLVVVASPFFPNSLAKGYDNATTRIVKSVNGIHVKNLSHLIQLLRDSKDNFLAFDFDWRNPGVSSEGNDRFHRRNPDGQRNSQPGIN